MNLTLHGLLGRAQVDVLAKTGAIHGLVQYDNAVTIRERDSMAQTRVPITELVAELTQRLGG